jgi:chemotaxis protein histidine kinase CheA
MPLLDSALAFAITMLALSLACSAVVELIHRVLKMRQAGFKYMLEQMFDQVLSKYVEPKIKAAVAADNSIVGQVAKDQRVKDLLDAAKKAFVERMRANRAPMGVPPNATPVDPATKVAANKSVRLGVWGGRELTELSPVGFMERLGTMDIGAAITDAAEEAKKAAEKAGQSAANYLDAALKDIAQKFEALGKDAADYFEGRARLISVVVAVVFAFVVHADAIDLYTTYLQNPNATAAVIAKSNAIQAQFKAAEESDDAKKLAQDSQKADGQNRPAEVPKAAAQDDVKKPPEDAQKAAQDDGKKQLEDAQKAAKAVKDKTEKMLKEFADVGVPLGWSDSRIRAANMWVLVWTCKALPEGKEPRFWTVWQECKANEADYGKANEASYKGPPEQYEKVWFGLPRVLNIWICLFLGGLLIGLGAPFWYNVVTSITNIRNAVGGAGGAAGTTGSTARAPNLLTLGAAPAEADKAQPATPAGAFLVAQAAKKKQ